MDENIYNLNLDYLILAHELIQSGRIQQAMVSLGLTPEAVNIWLFPISWGSHYM